MSLETLIALIGFAFVTSVSPGPGNFLLLTSGVNFGFVRSIPLILGISLGFLTMVLVVGLGFGQFLNTVPLLYAGLKIACITYVLWLAWKIASSKSLGNSPGNSPENSRGKASIPSDKPEKNDTPVSFLQAALLQLLNPKAWAVSLIVTVSFTTQDNYLPSLMLLILFFAMVNLPSISLWALSGTFLRRILGQGNRIVIFNRFMALLLIGSMLPVILGG
ncbi:LysE family translocator [Kiloniella sp.]|uniref:LysE family translocator n=1 Tax=Kiloniella sp. TaxID=1938587 RepID=UPI003B01CF50